MSRPVDHLVRGAAQHFASPALQLHLAGFCPGLAAQSELPLSLV